MRSPISAYFIDAAHNPPLYLIALWALHRDNVWDSGLRYSRRPNGKRAAPGAGSQQKPSVFMCRFSFCFYLVAKVLPVEWHLGIYSRKLAK